jgi:hypothetical protein
MLGTKLLPYTYEELENYTHAELENYTHKQLEGYPVIKNWTKDDYYNYWELNRIEEITENMPDFISLLKECPPIENTVTDRDMKYIEFKEGWNRVEQNIEILRNTLNNPLGTIESKTYWWYNMPYSFEDANRLEQNLRVMYEYVKGNLGYIQYCGMCTCGEEVI